jgi:hypothetical protein
MEGRYHALAKERTMLLRCENLEPPMSQLGQTRSFADVGSMSGSPPEAVVERTSADGREVPKCMARPRGTRWTSKINERESCINVSGLEVERLCSGPSWVSARIQADYRQDLEGPFWHPVSWLRRADRSSISSFHLADLGGEAVEVELLSLRSEF